MELSWCLNFASKTLQTLAQPSLTSLKALLPRSSEISTKIFLLSLKIITWMKRNFPFEHFCYVQCSDENWKVRGNFGQDIDFPSLLAVCVVIAARINPRSCSNFVMRLEWNYPHYSKIFSREHEARGFHLSWCVLDFNHMNEMEAKCETLINNIWAFYLFQWSSEFFSVQPFMQPLNKTNVVNKYIFV